MIQNTNMNFLILKVHGIIVGKAKKLLQNYLKLIIQELPRVPKAFCST